MLSSPRPSQGSRQVSTRSVQTASSRSGAATDAVTPHPEAPSLAPGSFATSRKTYGLCGQPALREPYRLSAAGCLDLVGRFSQSAWIHRAHWPVAVAASRCDRGCCNCAADEAVRAGDEDLHFGSSAMVSSAVNRTRSRRAPPSRTPAGESPHLSRRICRYG